MAKTDFRTEVYGRVYCATNLTNGKRYVGKTKHSIGARWRRHCKFLEEHSLLQRAIAKHGSEKFSVEELATADSADALDALERKWIATLGTISPDGYNLSAGGEGGSSHPSTRAKLSVIAKERWDRPEFKARMCEINATAAATPEARRIRSEKSKAAWTRPEHREAVRLAKESAWCREKIALASKAAWARPEHRERLLAAMKIKHSDPDFLRRRGKAISAGLARPGVKEKLAATMRVLHSNPEFLRRRGLAIAAGIARNKAARSA